MLATKFGQVRSPDGANLVDGRPEHVQRACDASLRRLGVDEIDLYYQHRVDPKVPIEETLETCRELGITFVAYSPLGRGFLSGRIQSGFTAGGCR